MVVRRCMQLTRFCSCSASRRLTEIEKEAEAPVKNCCLSAHKQLDESKAKDLNAHVRQLMSRTLSSQPKQLTRTMGATCAQ
ncbi:hypothetical protein V8E52_011959 [Russula decolorans]